MHQATAGLLLHLLPPRASILVSGIGTGQEAMALLASRPEWQLTGFDPSAAMIAAAGEKIQAAGFANQVHLHQGTIEQIAIDPQFDGATSILVMQLFADNGAKAAYLHALADRLKPGAPLVLIDLEGRKGSRTSTLLRQAWQAQQYASRVDREQINKDLAHADNNFHPIAEARLSELLTSAGFTDITRFYQTFLFGGFIAVKE